MDAYQADGSLKAKLRRRFVRFAARRPARAPGQPMVSFAFDDVPASATETGARILEDRGLKGTFYVAAGLAETDAVVGHIAGAEAFQRLAKAGHEIGCHTYSHRDCGQASADDAVADVQKNAETLAAWGLPPAQSFAYPFGDVAPGPKRALAKRFALMRALHHGLVEAGSDLNQAPAVGVEGPGGEALAMTWLGRAKQRRAWLILATHDVDDEPTPWGCTPGALARIADAALAAGFEVVTVWEGARRVGARP